MIAFMLKNVTKLNTLNTEKKGNFQYKITFFLHIKYFL